MWKRWMGADVRILGGLCLSLLASLSAAADELVLDAPTLFARGVNQRLRLAPDGQSIELTRGELIEDDGPAAGYSYRPNEEKLSDKVWIKKELLLANPRADRATLLVGRGGTLGARVNGVLHELGPSRDVGRYWQAHDLPPRLLRSGVNEIVLFGAGSLWIARDDEYLAGAAPGRSPPNRSQRSSDAGATWSDRRLGTAENVDGEYYVRLFLDRHASEGELTLPVIDLGNLGGDVLPAPVTALRSVRVDVLADGGETGRIVTLARMGPVPLADDRTWSAWREMGAAGGELPTDSGRYVQLAIRLHTGNQLISPWLRSIKIAASLDRAGDWTTKVRVLNRHNEKIVRTSIPFRYEPFPHPRLAELRRQFKLDEVVAGAKTELETMGRLAAWSSRLWERGHLGESYPAWDAGKILEPHADGKPVGGFCHQYNLVFLQACESLGFVGRCVSLSSGAIQEKIRSGHEVVEIWSNEHRKWIYVDGNTAWYARDKATGTPLSLIELRDRQLPTLAGKQAPEITIERLADNRHVWSDLTGFPPFVELRLIPRSNFLAQAHPLPLNQGMRGWFWTGHYAWDDDLAPAAPLYGHRVTRREDWSWTLNQAHYWLEPLETPGKIRVHLETETPNFATFQAKFNADGPRPVAATFTWQLNPGQNRLEVFPRNLANRDGLQSWLTVEYSR